MIARRRLTGRRVGRWLRGKSTLGALLRLKDRDRDDLARQAHGRLEAGDLDAAARLFELLGVLWPEHAAEARLGLGVCAQRRGDLDGAERAYGEVLAAEPDNPYALANRAEVRLLTERKEAARADLAAAAALDGSKVPRDLRRRVEALRALADAAS